MLDMQKIGIRLIHIDENQLRHLENKLKGKKFSAKISKQKIYYNLTDEFLNNY